jgi:hypothetical protein
VRTSVEWKTGWCESENGIELQFMENWKIVTFRLGFVNSSQTFRLKLCDTQYALKFYGNFTSFLSCRDACHEAWTNLRLSPMFGCICPNNHMKRRCDKIFNVVNHNPCVGKEKAFSSLFESQVEHKTFVFIDDR